MIIDPSFEVPQDPEDLPEDVVADPDPGWLADPLMSRVFLPKERKYAFVVIPYWEKAYWEEVRSSMGKISLVTEESAHYDYYVRRWDTTNSGRGFDRSRILLPVQGDARFFNPLWQVEVIKGALQEIEHNKRVLESKIEWLNTRQQHLEHLAEIQDIIE